jgi:hypothetical protein
MQSSRIAAIADGMTGLVSETEPHGGHRDGEPPAKETTMKIIDATHRFRALRSGDAS